jgi:hypothetical protein
MALPTHRILTLPWHLTPHGEETENPEGREPEPVRFLLLTGLVTLDELDLTSLRLLLAI